MVTGVTNGRPGLRALELNCPYCAFQADLRDQLVEELREGGPGLV